jgi:hypothetical protein
VEPEVAILLTCGCGRKLQIDDRFAGQQGRCPACGQTLDIPAGDQRIAPPPEVRAAPPPLPAGNGYPPPEGPVYPMVQEVEAPPPQQTAPPADGQRGPLTNHGGGELPSDADFFVPPPAEIGELVSAYTSMRQRDEPWTPSARLAWIIFASAIGMLLGVLIAILFRARHPAPLLIVPLLLGGIGLGIALLVTRFKRVCSYVGREGVARFRCTGSRENLSTRRRFLFRDATELRTAQTRHYTNGVYQGTNYSFTWTDINGMVCFTITGRHGSEKGTPALTHDYYFATSAEFAWTMHLLGQLEAKLTLGGGVTFHVNKNDWVRVGPGHLRFSFKGATMDCPVEEIGEARVEAGMFVIKRIDAREGWFSSEGVFKFPYSQLGNAQLFLIVLDKVAGVRLN